MPILKLNESTDRSNPFPSVRGRTQPDRFDSLESFHEFCLNKPKVRDRDQIRREGQRADLSSSSSSPSPKSIDRDGERKKRRSPSLVITHDFKGGYSENNFERGYSFEWLGSVDLFIYFSHHLITVPPRQWINACKNHNTKILGTLIFEWDKSFSQVKLLLKGPKDKSSTSDSKYYVNLNPNQRLRRGPGGEIPQSSSSDEDDAGLSFISTYFADRLIDLSIQSGFHGWLINVEVDLLKSDPLRSRQISRSIKIWLEYLRLEGEKRFGADWEICWYDSISHHDGRLQWQSSLHPLHNLSFFTASSSIFLDYHWTSNHLNFTKSLTQEINQKVLKSLGDSNSSLESIQSSQERILKLSSDYPSSLRLNKNLLGNIQGSVLVGVDVYGRGCPYGGGFSSWRATEEILRSGFSVSLFAPGWTWESHHLHPVREKSDLDEDKKKSWWKSWWNDELYFWTGLSSLSESTMIKGGERRIVKSVESPNAYIDSCRIAEESKKPKPIRGTGNSEIPQHKPFLELFPVRRPSSPQSFFYTNWSMGSGFNGYWVEGKQDKNASKRIQEWTDMSVSFPINDLSIGDRGKVWRVDQDNRCIREDGRVNCQLIDRIGWSGSGCIQLNGTCNEASEKLRFIWMNSGFIGFDYGESVRCRLVWRVFDNQNFSPLGIVLQIDSNDPPNSSSETDSFVETKDGDLSLLTIGRACQNPKISEIGFKKLDEGDGWYESVVELSFCEVEGSEKLDDSNSFQIVKLGVSFNANNVKDCGFDYYLGEMSVVVVREEDRNLPKVIGELEFEKEGEGSNLTLERLQLTGQPSSSMRSSSGVVNGSKGKERFDHGWLKWRLADGFSEEKVLMYLVYIVDKANGVGENQDGEEQHRFLGTVVRDDQFFINRYSYISELQTQSSLIETKSHSEPSSSVAGNEDENLDEFEVLIKWIGIDGIVRFGIRKRFSFV